MPKVKNQVESDYTPLSTKKIDSIDTAQLEYTAEKIFTYGTIAVSVIAVYAAIIYMGVQQLKK